MRLLGRLLLCTSLHSVKADAWVMATAHCCMAQAGCAEGQAAGLLPEDFMFHVQCGGRLPPLPSAPKRTL